MNSDYGIGCLASNVSLWKAPLAGGRPFLVTTSMGEPTNFVVAGTRIYTVDYQNNDVESYSTSGGADGPPISDQQAPWTLATDAEFVYWSTFGGTANTGVIAKLPIGGSAVTTLASGLAAPAALAVDDTNVYWVDTVCGAILKAPKNP
jgi:uncharacterized repeat protein (TIGR03803 family)